MHGLGKVIKEAPNSKEALELAKLNWQVINKPIYIEGNKIKGYVANVRGKDNKVLGIVSDHFIDKAYNLLLAA